MKNYFFISFLFYCLTLSPINLVNRPPYYNLSPVLPPCPRIYYVAHGSVCLSCNIILDFISYTTLATRNFKVSVFKHLKYLNIQRFHKNLGCTFYFKIECWSLMMLAYATFLLWPNILIKTILKNDFLID